MIFSIDMKKDDFIQLRKEVEESENSILLDFYARLECSARRQAEENKKESEDILSLDSFSM